MVTFYVYENRRGEIIPTMGTVAPSFPAYGTAEDGSIYVKDWFTYSDAFTVPDLLVRTDGLYIYRCDQGWVPFSEAYPMLKRGKELERLEKAGNLKGDTEG